MQIYASVEEIKALENILPTLSRGERMHTLVCLAWYKRQQDGQAALFMIDELEQLLADYGDTSNTNNNQHQIIELRSRLDLVRAEIFALSGNIEHAEVLLQQAKFNFARSNNLQAVGDAWIIEATLAVSVGDSPREAQACQQALDAYQRSDDQRRIELAEAWRIYELSFTNPIAAKSAMAELRQQGQFLDKPEIAAHLAAADGVIDGKRDPAHAANHYLRASKLATSCGLHRLAIVSAGNACEAFQGIDDLDSASMAIELAMNQAKQAKWPSMLGFCLAHLGRIQRNLNQIEQSKHSLEEALLNFPTKVGGINKAIALRELGETLYAEGNCAESLSAFREAIHIFRTVQSMDDLPHTLIRYARVLSHDKQVDCALEALNEAKELVKRYNYAVLATALYQTLAEIHQLHQLPIADAISEPNAVIHFLEQANRIGSQIEGWHASANFLMMLSDAWADSGHYLPALRYAKLANQAEREAGNTRVAYKTALIQDSHQTEKAQAEAQYHHLIAVSESNRARALQDTHDTLVKLEKIGQDITANLDLNSLFHAIHKHLCSLLDASTFYTYLMTPQARHLELVFGVKDQIAIKSHRIALHDPNDYVALCAKEKRELFINTRTTTTERTHSLLYAPLMVGDKNLGVMSLQSSKESSYNDRERLIFTTICAYAAIAVDNAQVYQQLQDTQDQLLKAIDKLNIAREKERDARQRAEESTRLKSEFLANMSHEIRTPMNAVIGMSYLALATELNPKQRDYLKKIQNAANSLLGIINDILDFSKIEAGKLNIERTSFSMHEVITNVTSLTSQKALEKGIRFQVQLPERFPHQFIGDPLRIGQVLTNLVNNAIKFTHRGQIDLSCNVTDVSNAEDGQRRRVHFIVKDTGIGISPAQQARLFQAFTQADGSTTRNYGGTGLGLSITKQLVDLMNGKIELHSSPGIGSSFEVFLDLAINEDKCDNPWEHACLRLFILTPHQEEQALISSTISALQGVSNTEIIALSSEAQFSALSENNSAILSNLSLLFCDSALFLKLGLGERLACTTSNATIPTIFLLGSERGSPESEMQMLPNAMRVYSIMRPIAPSQFIDYLRSHQHLHAHLSNQAEHASSFESPAIIPMPATPYKILLAEDNEFNQEIAVELLNQAGYAVEVANNGQDVLNKLFSVDAHYFHLILMDLEMPVMDGHQATLMIRQQKQFDHLPIIALTAHAMTGTKERCVEEGMQDYLTKPFEPNTLYDTINIWLGATRKQDLAEQHQQLHAHLDYPFHTIEAAQGLRATAQNQTLYLKLLNNFCDAQKSTLSQLIAQERHQPNVDFSRLIHTLKGASATIGAKHVADAAESYENYLTQQVPQQREQSAMQNIIAHIAKELSETINELDQYFATLDKQPSHAQAECSKEEINDLSSQLSKLLTASNVEALDYFEKELSKFDFILAEHYPDFVNAIRSYDFDSANELLQAAVHSKK